MTQPGMIDLYDTEVDKIHAVLTTLKERAESRRDFDAFDREIKERFWDAGFKVTVNWFHTDQAEVKMPEISVVGRVEEGEEFDHDRLRHEIVNDVLGLGTGGTIKVQPEDLLAAKAYEQNHKKHNHG